MAERYKNGDRVRDTVTGEAFILQGSQWIPIEVSGASSAAIGLFDKGVDNIGASLDVAGNALAQVSTALPAAIQAGVGAGINVAQGQPANFGGQFSENRERFLDTPAAQTLQNLPRTPPGLGENIRAGVRAIGPDTFDEALETEQRRRQQAEELFPRSFGTGEFGADAAAVVGLRKPIAAARGRQSADFVKEAQELTTGLKRGFNDLSLSQQEKLGDVVSNKIFPAISKGVTNLKTAGVKIGEASLEGAYLAALNDTDPSVAAGLAAGTQGAASLGLWLGTKPGRRLAPWVATTFVAHEMWKALAPGDQNFFESKDFAVQAATAGVALGVLGGLAGGGRFRGGFPAKSPQLADLITSVPRTAVNALWRELRGASNTGNQLPEQVMERMNRDPDFFNKNQTNSLGRAAMNGREGAFTKEIDRLMRESTSFFERVQLMQQQRTPPAGTERTRTGIPRRDLELGTPIQPIQRAQ